MQEEERNRYKSLIDRGNEVFERLDGHISRLNDRAISLVSLNLLLITLILTVILYLLDRDWRPPANGEYILISIIGLLIFSAGINLCIFKLSPYNEINVFEEERFNELKSMNEKRLLSNNLSYIREAYESNFEKYKTRTKWFDFSYYCHIIAVVILIGALIINLLVRGGYV